MDEKADPTYQSYVVNTKEAYVMAPKEKALNQMSPGQAESSKLQASKFVGESLTRIWFFDKKPDKPNILIAELVNNGITIRVSNSNIINADATDIDRSSSILDSISTEGYRNYCAKHNDRRINDLIKNMKELGQAMKKVNDEIIKITKLPITLVGISPEDRIYLLYKNMKKEDIRLILIKPEDLFRPDIYEDVLLHESSHSIFDYLGIKSRPNYYNFALKIAYIYSRLKKTNKVQIPTKRFDKSRFDEDRRLLLSNPEIPAGVVMIQDTLWAGSAENPYLGGHPWTEVDEFFASAYAGFIKQKELLTRIVKWYYENVDINIKPLSEELFELLNKLKGNLKVFPPKVPLGELQKDVERGHNQYTTNLMVFVTLMRYLILVGLTWMF